MKLIDKDKLHLTYKQGTYVGHGIYDGEGYHVDGNEVANAPIINAIPIERIVKRINYYSDLILKYPNEKELLYSQTELISLLEEWEKENEID